MWPAYWDDQMIRPLVRGEVDPGDWVNHNCLNKTKVSLDGLVYILHIIFREASQSSRSDPDHADDHMERRFKQCSLAACLFLSFSRIVSILPIVTKRWRPCRPLYGKWAQGRLFACVPVFFLSRSSFRLFVVFLWSIDLRLCSLSAIAEVHKNGGNDEFNKKEYRNAINSYTEGINVNCKDEELNAKLYSNRATAHFRLGKTLCH